MPHMGEFTHQWRESGDIGERNSGGSVLLLVRYRTGRRFFVDSLS